MPATARLDLREGSTVLPGDAIQLADCIDGPAASVTNIANLAPSPAPQPRGALEVAPQ